MRRAITRRNRANRKAYQAEIDALVAEDLADYPSDQAADTNSFQALMTPLVGGVTLLELIAGVLARLPSCRHAAFAAAGTVTETMARLADGDLSVEVPPAGEKNEIGQMAAAVQVFKENGIRVAEMNEDERTRHQKAARARRGDGAVPDGVSTAWWRRRGRAT